jgi:general secretion pathway protein K
MEPAGAEDLYYLALEAPYRTANRRIADISELLLVKGFSEARLRLLTPYITALPGSTKVNVNTASPELLAALLGSSSGDAKGLAAFRDKEPFASTADIMKRVPDSASKTASQLLDVRSNYFVAEGVVQSGRIAASYRALIGREGPTILAFSRDFG